MGKASDEIRGEIEDTRERMAETADAIRYRADVKSRTKEAVAEKKDSLVDKAGSAVSRVTGKMPSPGDVASEAGDMASSVGDAASSAASRVGDALPDTDQVKRQARQAVSVAQENPIGLAVGSIAVGFLVGMLIPRTQMEDQRLGELSDQVKEQARDVGREALDQGQDLAAEVGQRATEVAREGAKEHGQQLAESARESVQSLTEETGLQPGQEANPDPQSGQPSARRPGQPIRTDTPASAEARKALSADHPRLGVGSDRRVRPTWRENAEFYDRTQGFCIAPGRIRTSDPRLRRPPLCPLSYRRASKERLAPGEAHQPGLPENEHADGDAPGEKTLRAI